MAIVKNLWMRNTRKQIAGAVFYNLKGQTIQREKSAKVANPRTAAQMEQRVRLANMVNLYRINQPWMKRGAFENKKETWSDYNAFVSANSKISPVYLTKEEAGQGAAVIAPVVVTKGSLASVNVISDETNEQFVSDLYVGDLVIAGTTTAAKLSAALRANNNNFQEGDQISFILNFQGTTTDGVPYITARYYEFIIDSSDNRTLADLGLEGVIVADTWNEMQCLCLVNEGNVAGGTIIVSRTTSGNIKVSTQSIVLNQAAIAYLAGYTSNTAFQRAANSYGENDADFLASGYSGKASNVAVPTAATIMSVAGKNVGGVAPIVQAATPFNIVVSRELAMGDISTIGLTVSYYSGEQWSENQVIELTNSGYSISGNIITIDATASPASPIAILGVGIQLADETIISGTFQDFDHEVTP